MNASVQIKQITPQDLAALGVQDIAYVKATHIDGQEVFAIHAADGTQLAVMPSRETALAAVKQNDMEPVSLH